MGDGKTVCAKRCAVEFNALLIPFGANVSCKPISSKVEERLHQFGNKMLPRLLVGYVIRAGRGWSGDLLIADCEALANLSASDIHVQQFKHQEVAQEGKLLFPCADGSVKLFDLPHSPRAEMPVRENPEEKTVNTFGARVVSDFKYRQHEIHRTKLYIQDEHFFPFDCFLLMC